MPLANTCLLLSINISVPFFNKKQLAAKQITHPPPEGAFLSGRTLQPPAQEPSSPGDPARRHMCPDRAWTLPWAFEGQHCCRQPQSGSLICPGRFEGFCGQFLLPANPLLRGGGRGAQTKGGQGRAQPGARQHPGFASSKASGEGHVDREPTLTWGCKAPSGGARQDPCRPPAPPAWLRPVGSPPPSQPPSTARPAEAPLGQPREQFHEGAINWRRCCPAINLGMVQMRCSSLGTEGEGSPGSTRRSLGSAVLG